MPIDPRAIRFHTLGNKLVEEQKYNEAIAHYEKAIEIDPAYAAAHYHMAEAFEFKKIDEKAYDSYTRAITLNHSYAMLHIESGLDTLMSGPLGKAVAEFKKKKGISKDGVATSGPREGSPVELATKPAVKKEKPTGQKDLKPVKVHLRPSDERISTEAGSADIIIVQVLGAKDIPVAEGKVTFQIRNEPAQSDAFLGADPSKMDVESGPQRLILPTDGDGEVTVCMKSSKCVGLNRLEIQAAGLSPALFADNTHPGPVSGIEISPAEKQFTTGQEVTFSYLATDRFGNPIPELDLAVALYGNVRDKWEVENNAGGKTDSAGVFSHTFTMPTRGNLPCRLEVKNKKSGFDTEKFFKVVPGHASSMIFIPSKGAIPAGKKFTLKLRMMDEYDNPIEGLRAGIILKEAIGGKWILGEQTSDVTAAEGDISVMVTAPEEVGARAVFTAETKALPAGLITGADFSTVESRQEQVKKKPTDDLLDMGYDPGAGRDGSGGGGSEPALSLTDTFFREPGSGDISGLPDLGGDTFGAGSGPAGGAPPPKGPEFEGLPGGAAALEGLDLDIGGAAGTGGAFDAPVGGKKPGASIAGAGGKSSPVNTFEQLGAMLDEDLSGTGGQPERAPGDEYSSLDPGADEPFMPSRPVTDTAKGGAVSLDVGSGVITCRAGDVLPVKVKVTDAGGRPVSAGVSVTFTILETPGSDMDSYFLVPGGIQGGKTYESEPDLSGEVTSNIQVCGHCGSFNVAIQALSTSARVAVNVAPGVPSTIRVSAPSNRVAPGQTLEITAIVLDKFGNPVPGEFVAISLSEYTGTPGVLSGGSGMTDGKGEVRVKYQSSAGPGDSVTIAASNPNVGVFAVTPVTIVVAGDAQAAVPPSAPPPKTKPPAKTPPGRKPVFAKQPPVTPPVSEAILPGISETELSIGGQQYALADLPPLPGGERTAPPDEEQYQYAEPSAPIPPGAPQPESYAPPPGQSFPPPGQSEAPAGAAESEYDDYLKQLDQKQDPYAPPTFEIKRGKKPVMEVSRVAPRIMKIFGIIAGIAILALVGLLSYKTVMYKWYYQRGVRKFTADDYSSALPFFEKASAMNPKQTEPLSFTAQIYIFQAEKAAAQRNNSMSDSQYIRALQELDKLLKLNPNDSDALYLQGKAYEGKGSYCLALGSFENISKIDPNDQGSREQAKSLRKKCDEEKMMRDRHRRGGTRR